MTDPIVSLRLIGKADTPLEVDRRFQRVPAIGEEVSIGADDYRVVMVRWREDDGPLLVLSYLDGLRVPA